MASAKPNRTDIRRDPVQRPTGASPVFSLKNHDPSRHYVWVFLATPADGQGVEYYEWMGYQVEKYGPDGPRPAAGRQQPGGSIEVRGHVLMSCSKEKYEELKKYGPEGDAGQAKADVTEKHMIRRRGEFDPLRGLGSLHGRSGAPAVYMSGGEVSPLQTELGAG